ncbi:chromosome partitioning protein [Azospirillum lipoferum]|uniref:ParA family protein n=2 Tax=Azospirillum TaxID=191 RepID=A0A5A9GUR1_AZOLI|nr:MULTISPECIES: ParA family partition ATPase [Azospirillum]KAA0598073.1 ParA family protein [Azospirillum lipoferum]MCP1613815.1 chromosome partitioning protein [Azospirillum lipoferum]MDW5534733.1 ParA family partition ATPase [Azospirillum sp. NL1]
MTGKVFTVAQQKGGAGKTTLAAHLAIAWAQLGHKVATVDIDPQGSLTRWHAVRAEATGGQPGFTHVQITGWRTQAEVEKLARSHDIVVVDSPPHAQTEARIAVRAATLVVAPVQPSPMDLWAVHPTIDLAAQEKRRLLLVLNRVPPRARIADELVAKVHELVAPPAVELASAQVGNRTAYAGTLMTGLSVTEAARKTQAAAEMQALAEEILGRV